MKKLILSILLTTALLGSALAQEVEIEEVIDQIVPIIEIDSHLPVGEEVIFDAEESKLVSTSDFGTPSYSWDFGDNSGIQFGKQIRHAFAEPGAYRVKLNIKQGSQRESVTQDILAFQKKALLLSDRTHKMADLAEVAADKGIWLKEITFDNTGSDVSIEDAYINQLQENLDFLQDTELIIFHTRSSIGVQGFAQFWQRLSTDKKFDLKDKLLVQISEDRLSKVAKLTQPAFEILLPNFILLTRSESLNPIFIEDGSESIENLLRARGIEFVTIDNKSRGSWWLPLSRLINFFVTNGISPNVIYLLLAVPFLTFVIAFFRQFVGVSTFGVFTPLMLSLSFLVLGLNFGFIAFLVVMLVSYIIRMIFDRVELLYVPKVSLLLSCLALSFLLVLGLAVYMEYSLDLALAIFPMMVMATLSEKFLSSQSSQGLKGALIATAETVIVSLIAYAFVDSEWVRNNVLALSELVLLPVLANIWLGKFTGLRIAEYLKFRSLFADETQE